MSDAGAADGGRDVAVIATPETLARATQTTEALLAAGDRVSFVASEALVRAAPGGATAIAVGEPEVTVTPPYLTWSYAVYRTLSGRELAAVVFPSLGGHGYCAARARQVGADFAATAIVVDCGELTLRAVERERRPFLSKRVLGVGVTERITLELADAYVCEDEGVAGWLGQNGWAVPDQRLRTPSDDVTAEERSLDLRGEPPLVSVVIAFHERTKYLPFCLEGLARETYPALEVVIADDGSVSAEAVQELGLLERRSWPWPLRVERLPHGGLGSARDGGRRAARGDLVLFVDDDDVPFEGFVATLVRSRVVSGADVVVAGARFFRGEGEPVSRRGDVIRISLCEPRELGLISNQFGGPVNLWPRDLLDRLGGFSPVLEDWATLARATYAGARLTTPPDPLYWYRQTPESMYSADPTAFRDAGIPSLVRPVGERLPEEWRLLPRLAAGAYSELERRQRTAQPRWRAAVERGRLLAQRAREVGAEEGITGVGRSAVRFAWRRYDRSR